MYLNSNIALAGEVYYNNTMMLFDVLLNALFMSGALGSCAKSDLNTTLLRRLQALSGTCLHISCSFEYKPTHKIKPGPIFGVWLKNNTKFKENKDSVIFNSSNTNNNHSIAIIGNMTQKNCTSVFYNMTSRDAGMYYFRVENTPFKATDICNALEITVSDSAPAPSIQTEGTQRDGNNLTLTCRAVVPCPTEPPLLKWTQFGGAEGRVDPGVDERPDVQTLRKTICLSDRHDGVHLTCSAEYPAAWGAGQDPRRTEFNVTLNVSYTPKDTLASASPPAAEPGAVVNLTCTSRANPPVHQVTWFMSTERGFQEVSKGPLLNFSVSRNPVTYYCVAENALGNQTSPQISIGGPNSGENVLLIVGGIIGAICFIGLVICVLFRSLRSKPSTLQQTKKPVGVQAAGPPEEEIHYGEIDFSRRSVAPRPGPAQPTEEPTTVYADISSHAQRDVRPHEEQH